MFQRSPGTVELPQIPSGTGPEGGGASCNTHQTSHWMQDHVTHHSAHGSRFLHPEGLHHLEHIHHSLCLAPLNGGGYGTEHARAAHRVTAGRTPPHSHTDHTHHMATAHLQCTTMGWLPVLLWTFPTSSITSVTVLMLEQLPSGAQLVMWNWLT